ncbi:MAG: N-acylglucosamine 2-epimerase, partial [Deltaproteobacteria bacterium]|nr:N-acylglucosamine 2-epimerase [Deltaproteobacteria bacterium]
MFSECFYVMALAEYARASGDATARAEAREMFEHVIRYAKDPSLLGKPSYPHLPAT